MVKLSQIVNIVHQTNRHNKQVHIPFISELYSSKKDRHRGLKEVEELN